MSERQLYSSDLTRQTTRTASIYLLVSSLPRDLLQPRLYLHPQKMTRLPQNLVLPPHQSVPESSFLGNLAPTTPSHLLPVVASLLYRRRDHYRIGSHRVVKARRNLRKDTQVLADPNPLRLV